MRHPLWLVNAAFIFLLAAIAVFTFFSTQKTPKRIALEPQISYSPKEGLAKSVDITPIYENDLFNTYHKVITEPIQKDFANAMPAVPTQSSKQLPPDQTQPFLPPLNIKLRGIISVDDESNNIAIIADTKTTEQQNYKPGDTIEDARLIKVLPNKAIFIRSNGQQETLYMQEKDLESDPALAQARTHWINVVKKAQENLFLVDAEVFIDVVKNVAQLIDTLNLTTVYQKGKNIGCRVGNIESSSLGIAMGLEPYDIITNIDGYNLSSTDLRYAAYSSVIKKIFGQTVVVDVIREEQPLKISYKLQDLKGPLDKDIEQLRKSNLLSDTHQQENAEGLADEKINLLKAKYKCAPTKQDIKVHQKISMFEQGKRDKVKQFRLDK
jgi:type II secretory pathway component PulC